MTIIAEGKIPPDQRFANHLGTVLGGFIATLIDSATGCAAHTTLNKGEIFVTIDLNAKTVRPIPIHKEIFGEGEEISTIKE